MSTRLPIVIGPTGQQQQVQAGDTLKVQSSTTGGASLSIPHGTAPSSPNNGDFWSTTSGFYGRVNGATVGPFGSGGGIADADYGDVVVSSSGTVWTIDANVVSNAKLRQSAGLSVVGRSANTTGNVADITATTDQVLRESGGTLGFGTVATAGIANSAVTLAKIASASASSKLLGSGASGSGAAYAELTLGTGLSMSGTTLNASGGSGTVTTTGSPSSGNLAAFSGSTSITNSSVNAFLDSEFSSTQGAVLYRGASAWAALGSGSSGQVLQSNGAAANPSWATPSGGSVGSGAMVLISEVVTSGSQADVTFSGIPATYRDLYIVVRGRMTGAVTNEFIRLQFNSDTSTNYSYQQIQAFSTSFAFTQATGLTSMIAGQLAGASGTANYAGSSEIAIADYRGTTFFKSVKSTWAVSQGSGTFSQGAGIFGGTWISTSAITAVKVFLGSGNFVNNSVVTLYGRY